MKTSVIRFLREEDGITAIEYGLIAGLISVLIVGVLTAMGGNLTAVFTSICNSLKTAASSAGVACS